MNPTLRPRSAHATVLYADHDGDVRFVYHSAALHAGLGIELAYDGYEAILLAHVFRPDAMILADGASARPDSQVLRRLRRSEMTRDIPIVLMTDEGLQAGRAAHRACDACLPRSSTAADVLRLAVFLIDHPRGPRASRLASSRQPSADRTKGEVR